MIGMYDYAYMSAWSQGKRVLQMMEGIKGGIDLEGRNIRREDKGIIDEKADEKDEEGADECFHCDWVKRANSLASADSQISIHVGIVTNTLQCIWHSHSRKFSDFCQMQISAFNELCGLGLKSGVFPKCLHTNVSLKDGVVEHLHCWGIYFEESDVCRGKQFSEKMFRMIKALNVDHEHIEYMVKKVGSVARRRPWKGDRFCSLENVREGLDVFDTPDNFGKAFLRLFRAVAKRPYEHGMKGNECSVFVDLDFKGRPIRLTVSAGKDGVMKN